MESWLMDNPYAAPESKLTRKVPHSFMELFIYVILLTSVVGLFVIFSPYSATSLILDVFLKNAVVVYLACNLVQWALFIVSKVQMDTFLRLHPIIHDDDGLDALKLLIRRNMYGALIVIPLTLISILSAIMSVMQLAENAFPIVITVIVCRSLLAIWVKQSENKIKNVQSSRENINDQIDSMVQCWFGKALPNF